ncbi:outer membrane beta-barrel protein [Olivibacter sp. SDN3]|uniref:TonB-dependent receptor n=1 Tax=Olivibacter sp. SDN3 TaxID=2764720 RepID=UPI00165133FA|nr:outer membrane beta-barrel protein [Olivibacter sp. SDN3]QNL52131.1 outer membrane beta-barrel protein [Olivibacter sp. SDN3]
MMLVFVFFVEAKGQVQTREVRGVVQDSTGRPLVGVTVRLYAKQDTMMVSTNDQGRFVFNKVAANDFKLTFSLIGFQLFERQYTSNVLLPITELVTVNLKEQPQELQEIAVYGVVPVVIKQDTVQYNARAYDVRENALLEEMIKLMPGLQVDRNGNIDAQGQRVTRVKVNGKDFFDGDVLTATRNLPADIIENIQIIDDYGDQANITGIRNTEPEKVLNVTIKDEKNFGAFGQVTAGGGVDLNDKTHGRYIGSFSANRFNGSKQLSILGSTNNTNTSLFSFGDVSGAGSRNGPDLNSMMDAGDGVNTANSIGVNYRDDIAQGVTVYGGYTFTKRDNQTVGTSGLQSIYQNRVINARDEVNSRTENIKHKLTWTIEANIDTANYLKITPTASYLSSKLLSETHSTITNNAVFTDRIYNVSGASSDPNFDIDIFYNHRFPKNGRNFTFTSKIDYYKRNRDDDVNDFITNIDSAQSSASPSRSYEIFNQRVHNFSYDRSLLFNIAYTEPVTKRSYLELNYQYESNSIANARNTFGIDTLTSSEQLIDSLSIDYDYLFQTHQFGLNYQGDIDRFKYTVGFALQPTKLDGKTPSREVVTHINNLNFVPSARLQYSINKTSNLAFSYRGQNNQPTFTQIQPIRDITNPQYVVVGNANLKPEFMNMLSLQYRHFSIHNGSSFFTNLSFTHVQDKVVANRISSPNSTIQETEFLNADGFYDMRGFYHYSTPLAGKILTLNLNGSLDYTNNLTYLNNVRNVGKNIVFAQNLQMNFQIEDLIEADLRSSYTVNKITYDIPTFIDSEANTFSLGFGSKCYLPKKWILSVDFSQRLNTGYSNYINVNPTLLNVYIEKSFFQNDMAAIRVQGFDLFNQNTGVRREVTGNDIFDVRNNRLARYFLVSLNIRLQKFPSGS